MTERQVDAPPGGGVASGGVDLKRRALARLFLCAPIATPMLASCGGSSGGTSPTPPPPPIPPPTLPPGPPVSGPPWPGFARTAQHAAIAEIATQPFNRVRWLAPVDLAPQYTSSGALLIHYGSPVISTRNTVIVPVKTAAAGAFRLEARLGSNGILLWSADSDYTLPPHAWVPSFNPCITAGNRLYAPRAGGRLLFRDDVDSTTDSMQTAAFYGAATYAAAPAAYDGAIRINTPLTADSAGNVYFGFIATANPASLTSGIARLAADGTGIWVSAAAAAGNASIGQVAMNCAPALSADEQTLYVAVNTPRLPNARQTGMLLALDSTTLATRNAVPLTDPLSGTAAWVNDDATSSPTVGPDGDVYYGVLEANAPAHNFRGWLLHFDATLASSRTRGSFGWDTTASIVPAAMVPGYAGTSPYLLATKYNNYGGAGTGDGRNRVAVLDPHDTQTDTISGIPVMKEVLTILGPTPDPGFPGGVKEWCINTAAVDPLSKSILVNSEDGRLYRWDMATNRFTESIALTSGVAEAYTPTAIGPDGAIYAVNNAVLFSIGS